VFGKVNLNSRCVPIFQSLTSTVAKIGRGSQRFWMLPWHRPPPIWSKTLFFGKLVSKPSCVPNLKLLASTVAKIRRGSQIFYAPLAQTLANFGPKRCLLAASPKPNLCTKFEVAEIVRGVLQHHHDGEGSGTLLTQTLPKACVPTSTVAEICRGSQIFGCSPSQAPLRFWS